MNLAKGLCERCIWIEPPDDGQFGHPFIPPLSSDPASVRKSFFLDFAQSKCSSVAILMHPTHFSSLMTTTETFIMWSKWTNANSEDSFHQHISETFKRNVRIKFPSSSSSMDDDESVTFHVFKAFRLFSLVIWDRESLKQWQVPNRMSWHILFNTDSHSMQVTWKFFLQIYSHLTTLSPLDWSRWWYLMSYTEWDFTTLQEDLKRINWSGFAIFKMLQKTSLLFMLSSKK